MNTSTPQPPEESAGFESDSVILDGGRQMLAALNAVLAASGAREVPARELHLTWRSARELQPEPGWCVTLQVDRQAEQLSVWCLDSVAAHGLAASAGKLPTPGGPLTALSTALLDRLWLAAVSRQPLPQPHQFLSSTTMPSLPFRSQELVASARFALDFPGAVGHLTLFVSSATASAWKRTSSTDIYTAVDTAQPDSIRVELLGLAPEDVAQLTAGDVVMLDSAALGCQLRSQGTGYPLSVNWRDGQLAFCRIPATRVDDQEPGVLELQVSLEEVSESALQALRAGESMAWKPSQLPVTAVGDHGSFPASWVELDGALGVHLREKTHREKTHREKQHRENQR